MSWSWLSQVWNQYKYRFVPWIVLNLKSNQKIRRVKTQSEDKIIPDSIVAATLQDYYQYLEERTPFELRDLRPCLERLKTVSAKNADLTFRYFGFTVERRRSAVDRDGRGVYVTRGNVPERAVVALYPGTVYLPSEPILLQSVRNKFVFKCSDSTLIDGNDRGLSKLIYKSLSERDRCGVRRTCDQTWLSDHPWNTLAIGQYVNNATSERQANVAYQEIYLPDEFPLELLRYHCNTSYSARDVGGGGGGGYKSVVLVALRDICEGEELLSTYFTIIKT